MKKQQHPLYGISLSYRVREIIEAHNNDGDLTISGIARKLSSVYPVKDIRSLEKRIWNRIKALAESNTIKIELHQSNIHKLPYIKILT